MSGPARRRGRVAALLAGLRPSHAWKNVPVLAAPLFGHRLWDPHDVLRAGIAFAAFSALASAGYLVNDVVDAAGDREHPRRSLRPVAAGELSPRAALAAGAALAALGLAAAFAFLPLAAAVALLGYLALTLAYSLALKAVPGMGPAAVAAGFVVRVLVGALAVGVDPSPWLLALTGVLALALATGKREAEARRAAGSAPPALCRATDALLLASALGYAAYTAWPSTVALHGTRWLLVTAVPVVLALARFRARLRSDASGLSPAEIVAGDPVLLALGAAWAAACAVVLGT